MACGFRLVYYTRMGLSSRLLAITFALTAASLFAQEVPRQPTFFSLDDVVKLVHAGVAEDVIVAQIKHYKKPFELNSDEILELKRNGVSDVVIRYLLDPAAPYSPPPPPAPLVATPSKEQTGPPKDPLIAKIPPEPGLYWLASAEPGNETFKLIELKPIVPMKPAHGLGSLMKGGLAKGHTVGFLVGATGKQRVSASKNVFFGRLPEKTAIEDVILLHLDKGEDRRILDFGPKPSKPVFPPDSIRPFESKLLGEGLYRLDVPELAPNEYVFLILGSGDEKKGTLGKGYDFVVAPHIK